MAMVTRHCANSFLPFHNVCRKAQGDSFGSGGIRSGSRFRCSYWGSLVLVGGSVVLLSKQNHVADLFLCLDLCRRPEGTHSSCLLLLKVYFHGYDS